jgi:hypothetical protein
MEGIMKSSLAVLALAMLLPVIAGGQAPPAAVGARVRVTAPSHDLERETTTIMDVRGDSIVIGDRHASRAIALTDVTALEVSTGKRRHVLRDAGLGSGIGIVAGLVVGAVTYKECVSTGFGGCWMAPESRTESAGYGAVLFGAAGLVTGAIVGLFDRTDQWASAALPVQAAIRPTGAGGINVMLSRAF